MDALKMFVKRTIAYLVTTSLVFCSCPEILPGFSLVYAEETIENLTETETTTDETSTEEAAAEEAAGEEAVAEEAVAEETGSEESAAEETVIEEAVPEEPAVEDEPVVVEPVVEEVMYTETPEAEEAAVGSPVEEPVPEEVPAVLEPAAEPSAEETVPAEEPLPAEPAEPEALKAEVPTTQVPSVEEILQEEIPSVSGIIPGETPGAQLPAAAENIRDEWPEKEEEKGEREEGSKYEEAFEQSPSEDISPKEPAVEETEEAQSLLSVMNDPAAPLGVSLVAKAVPVKRTVESAAVQAGEETALDPIVSEEGAEMAEKAVVKEAAPSDVEDTVSEPVRAMCTLGNTTSAPAMMLGTAADTNNDSPVITLQKMIAEKISSEGTQSRISIILSRNVNYDGDVEIAKEEGKEYGEGFGIDLMAEDAGEDFLQADGSTAVVGNINIRGINVAIKGVTIAAGKKVSVADAVLDHYGTKKDDAIIVEAGSMSSVNIRTGTGDDNVDLLSESGGTAVVETGSGADTIHVDAHPGTGNIKIDAGEGDDAVMIENRKEEQNTGNEAGSGSGGNNAEIEADLGTGADRATVDMTAADATKIVTVKGGDGSDSMNLTGSLKKGEAGKDYQPITGELDDLTLEGSRNKVNIKSEGIEAVTEELENKRTIEISTDNGGMEYTAEDRYTDYVIDTQSGSPGNISVRTMDGETLALTNLVIKNSKTGPAGNSALEIPEGTVIEVRGMTLKLAGQEIRVDGTLKGDRIEIRALDGTDERTCDGQTYKPETAELKIPVYSEAQAAMVSEIKMGLSVINVKNTAAIVIGEKAAVISSGDVILLAKAEQSGGILTLTDSIPVNVKIGKASIDIAGKVFAGYDFENEKTGTGEGSVKAEALVKNTTGYDKDGSLSVGTALGVNVGIAGATMNVAESADIRAAGDIRIGSGSDVKAAAHSEGGAGGLPIGLTTTVLLNDVRTTVNGWLTAGRDVDITSEGKADALALSEKGEKTDSADSASASGAYVSVAVVLQDVKAETGRNALIHAGGAVKVLSTADEKVDSRAVSTGENRTEASENRTASLDDSLLSLAKTILGSDSVSSEMSKSAKEKIDGTDLTGMAKDATGGAEEGSSSAKTRTQNTGAFAAVVAGNNNMAVIDSGTAVTSGKNTEVKADAGVMITTLADGSAVADGMPGAGNDPEEKKSVQTQVNGAGIALTVANHENRAEIRDSVTSGGDIKVGADTKGEVKTETKAGFSTGDIGLGGAVAVQAASLDTKALVSGNADLKLIGQLGVSADSDLTYLTAADAAGTKEGTGTGVGAAIAVAVNGSDTSAAVEDGAKLAAGTKEGTLTSAAVIADQKIKDVVTSKAGAAGGTSVSPSAAVDVNGANVRAYMGTAAGEPLKAGGNVSVSAANSASHDITSDVSSAGKETGVGAAVSTAVLSDKALAQLKRSIEADQAAVTTQNISKVNNRAVASASGGKSGGESADSQVDRLLEGAAKLSKQNQSSGVSADSITDVKNSRQKAETAEGSVGAAGAVAVNVQESESRSEILDGIKIKTAGLLSGTAENGTISKVKANAGTTGSDTGVGVGAAVNTVTLNNLARIGDNEIEADKLNLAAVTKETEGTGHVIDTQAISGAGASDVGVAGSVAITVLNSDTGTEITDGTGRVTTAGDMTMQASERRSVNNVASGAVDEKGNADANKSAAESTGNKENNTEKSVGVGAAFSMVYGDSAVNTGIGKRSITAGSLNMTAGSEHREDIASAAGTDPVSDGVDESQVKKYSFDASAALNILDNSIQSTVADGAVVRTMGNKNGSDGSLTLKADEKSITETTSSAFTVSGKTAVGASTAINLASSDVGAKLIPGAAAEGSVDLEAASHSEDTTSAIATAMGADIARALYKAGQNSDQLEEKADGVLTGDYLSDDKDETGTTKTSQFITKRMNEKGTGDQKANANNSVSQNMLRSQAVKTAGGSDAAEGTGEAEKKIKESTGKDVSASKDDEGTAVQAAAAVGVTVAAHEAAVQTGKIIAGKGIKAAAVNTGNFSTQGNGASMSLAEHANAIAAGVAVSVNNNKAGVKVTDDLVSENEGDISVTSRLTQNLDNGFAGKLGAQAISGSVAGKDSKESLAGAVSVLVSHGQSGVEIAGGSESAVRNIKGGNVKVEATDQSRLTARAGGLSLSDGSSLGMGLASANIVSAGSITAKVGDYTQVEAGSFTLNAEKQAVTPENNPDVYNLRSLETDSGKLTNEQRSTAETGLIDVQKGEDDKSYKMNVGLTSEKLLGAIDSLNFLSGQNLYAEAVAGSVTAGSGSGNSKASLSGSFAVAAARNTIQALLGSNVKVNLTKSAGQDGSMAVTAGNGTTTRIIAGSLSAALSKAVLGATVSVLADSDQVSAGTGSNAQITTDGDFTQEAYTTGNIQVFNAAMALAAEGGGSSAAGNGAVNVIVTKNRSESILGDNAAVKSNGSTAISSRTVQDLMVLSGGLSAGAAGTAAGGTVNVIVDGSGSVTKLGEGNAITAAKDLTVSSDVSDQLVSGTASASAAPEGSAVAGVVNVVVSKSAADTTIGKTADLNARAGDLKVNANNDAWMLNASLEAAGGGKAIGGAFNVNVFNRSAKVNMTDGTLTAGGDVKAQASGRDTNIIAGLAAAGGISGAAFSGNVIAAVMNSTVRTDIEKGITVNAGRNALLESYYSDYDVIAAGSIAASGGGSAIGATIVTAVRNNNIRTRLAGSKITAKLAGDEADTLTLNNEQAGGVYVGANARETQIIGGAGAAASGSGAGVNGVVTTLVNNNKVAADAGKAALKSEGVTKEVPVYEDKITFKTNVYERISRIGTNSYRLLTPAQIMQAYYFGSASELSKLFTKIGTIFFPIGAAGRERLVESREKEQTGTETRIFGSVSVKAADDTRQSVFAGGLSAGTGAGVGAAVVTLVSNKDVQAIAHSIDAGLDANVEAANTDDIIQLAISAGVSGSAAVQIGAAVQVLKSKTAATVDSGVTAHNGSFTLKSDNDTKLYNIGAAVAAGSNAAVTPVGVVTYFQGESKALLKKGNTILAARDVTVSASGNKDINMYAVGASAGGSAAVSGTANVLVSRDQVRAAAENGTNITAGNVSIHAQGDYRLRSASAAIAGSGGASPAINAVVSILKSKVSATLDGKVNAAGGKVNVTASGKRNVISTVAGLGAGTAGVGVNVLVLVTGTKMSQDAADMIKYGNYSADERKAGKTTFDSASLLNTDGLAGSFEEYEYDENGEVKLDGEGNPVRKKVTTLSSSDLEGDLAGNGRRESTLQAGSKNKEGQVTFSGAENYRSGDFDNNKYNDDSDTQRGENLKVSDSKDVTSARNLNTYSYADEPDDEVKAEITSTSVVTARDVAVTAAQPVAADLISAVIGAGQAGIGIGTTVAILRSNVFASSKGRITADGSVNIEARSVSGILEDDTESKTRDTTVSSLLNDKVNDKDKLDPSGRSIRAVGLAVGAGQVGAAVSVAVVLTDNITAATLANDLKYGTAMDGTAGVTVKATHDYGRVLAATDAVSGGAVSAGASVAVAQANGKVEAVMDSGIRIPKPKEVNLATVSNVSVDALAAAAGAGAVSINAGLALALNRITQNTGAKSGAATGYENPAAIDFFKNNDAPPNLNVTADSNTSANSYILGVAIGGGAATLNAAVSDVDADINTFIGEGLSDGHGHDFDPLLILADKLVIRNNVTSTAKARALTLAAGGIAVGGNVLLAFNDSKARAGLNNTITAANEMTVASNMNGTVDSRLSSALIGGAAVGVSTNFADMRGENWAFVRDSELYVRGDLNVAAGEDARTNGTTAIAETTAGTLGGITAGLNAAIARNNAKNYARLDISMLDNESKKKAPHSLIVEGNLNVLANDNATADAGFTGATVSLGDIQGTLAAALNDVDNRAVVLLPELTVGKKSTFNTGFNGNTTASIKSGRGNLVSAGADVAVAYGRAVSVGTVEITEKARLHDVEAHTNAKDVVKAAITNQEISGIAAGAKIGAAYNSGDLFYASVKLGKDGLVDGNADVRTTYETSAEADVNPSTGGIAVNLASLDMNMALAHNNSNAGSNFQGVKGTVHVTGDVNSIVTGSAVADAKVHTAKIEANALGMGVNYAKADLSSTQAAYLRVGGTVNIDGNADVQAVVQKASASSQIGASGSGKDTVSFGLGDLKVNRSVANERLASTAAVVGGPYDSHIEPGYIDMGYWETRTVTEPDYDTVVGFKYSLGDKPIPLTKNGKRIWVKPIEAVSYTGDKDGYLGILEQVTELYKQYGDEFLTIAFGDAKGKTWKGAVLMYLQMEALFPNECQKHRDTSLDGVSRENGYLVAHGSLYQQRKKDVQALWENFAYKNYSHTVITFARTMNLFNLVTEEAVFPEVTHVKEVWVKKLKPYDIEVDDYDPRKNSLNVGGWLNVFDGVAKDAATTATSSTGGAYNLKLYTAGSNDSKATTGDTYSVLFEGLQAVVKDYVHFNASGKSNAVGTAFNPGGLTAVDGSFSTVTAGVGERNSNQSVVVVFGENSGLTATGQIMVEANNHGSAEARTQSADSWSLGKVQSTKQPTESWYNTLISVGRGAKLTSTSQGIALRSIDAGEAKSTVDAESLGFFINFNDMMGKNTVYQTNNIDIVDGAVINAAALLGLQALQHTVADAQTKMSGGGILSGNTAKAQNDIDRIVRLNIGKNASLTAERGLTLQARSGVSDDIYTSSYISSGSAIDVSKAQAYANINSSAEVNIGSGAVLCSKKKLLSIETINTSVKKTGIENSERGIETRAAVDSGAGIPLPDSVAKTTLNFHNFININKGSKKDGVKLTGYEGIRIDADNQSMKVLSNASSVGKGAAGVSNATSWIDASMENAVWVDKADLTSDDGRVVIFADNGHDRAFEWEKDLYKAWLQSEAFTELKAAGGKVAPNARITGTTINQIRSANTKDVKVSAPGGFEHTASSPQTAILGYVKADYERTEVKVLGVTLSLTAVDKREVLEWYYFNRCDFCGKGTEVDVEPSRQEDLEERNQDAYERAYDPIIRIDEMVRNLPVITDTRNVIPASAVSSLMSANMVKAVSPLNDISRVNLTNGVIYKAAYGEEDTQAASSIFALDLSTVLTRDVVLNREDLARYLLWTNMAAHTDVYLLPNAARLYGTLVRKLDFVAEVLRGDVRDNGEVHEIDVITALTDYAFTNPVMPVGSSASLDFLTGELTLPDRADFELFLHEVSGNWLVEKLEEGFIRRLAADQEALNDTCLNGADLPDGMIVESITEGGEIHGRKQYWLGDTPETADDPDETLLFLLVDEFTDEVDAFRTSVHMMENSEEPVDVSLYLFRDSKSDRKGIEKYNAVFFDTPEGEKSLLKVVTDVLQYTLEIPRPLRIVLRSFRIDGADLPVYSLSDHFFALCDGTDGKVSMFDGFYEAEITDDTFESDYIYMEGLLDSELKVTMKEGQPAWAEWTGENTAVDQNGTKYKRIDDVWQEVEEIPEARPEVNKGKAA